LANTNLARTTVRVARPDDAGQISDIYQRTYRVESSEQPGDDYPYPQFFDSGWVEDALARDQIQWLVAEAGTTLTGALGTAPSIGAAQDQVAACFGLAVRREWQRKGCGKSLMAAQVELLRGRAVVMIGETRTGDPAAYRVTRSAGWRSFGFEPFAHKMPTGAEPMLLMGYVFENAIRRQQSPAHVSPAVEPLARAVLSHFGGSVPRGRKMPVCPVDTISWRIEPSRSALETRVPAWLCNGFNDKETFYVTVAEGKPFENDSGFDDVMPCARSVIPLRHLQAEDLRGERVKEVHFESYIGRHRLAFAHLVWDFHDRRVRIKNLVSRTNALEGLMLSAVLSWLDHACCARKSPLSVTVDIRADQPAMQGTLEQLGFFPTAYYPGLVSESGLRRDAVQYMRLSGQDFEESLKWLKNLDLAEGAHVFKAVALGAGLAL